MKKVLVINTAGLGIGGITTHMLNYIEKLREEYPEVEFTIAVTGIRSDEVISEFGKLGCRIIYLPDRKKKIARYVLKLSKVIKHDKYDILHVHGNSSTMIIEMAIGKINKIVTRIAHCHNTICNHPFINTVIKPIFKTTYTKAVACSKEAGDWLFGKNQFIILPNAIDIGLYDYNFYKREVIRKSLGISKETLLIGHVGNFNEQKNHNFLLKVFYEIQIKVDAQLLLVGDGILFDEIKQEVNKLNLKDKVIFLGIRNDVPDLMQAMDCFVLPSKWEGLGIVNIEAQASGLPVFVSDKVPPAATVTNNIYYISLTKSEVYWASFILKKLNSFKREKVNDSRLYKYSLEHGMEILTNIYDL